MFTDNVLIREYQSNGSRFWFVADEYRLTIFKFKKRNLYTKLEADTFEGKFLYTLAFGMILFTPWLYLNAKKFNKHLASLKTTWYSNKH